MPSYQCGLPEKVPTRVFWVSRSQSLGLPPGTLHPFAPPARRFALLDVGSVARSIISWGWPHLSAIHRSRWCQVILQIFEVRGHVSPVSRFVVAGSVSIDPPNFLGVREF